MEGRDDRLLGATKGGRSDARNKRFMHMYDVGTGEGSGCQASHPAAHCERHRCTVDYEGTRIADAAVFEVAKFITDFPGPHRVHVMTGVGQPAGQQRNLILHPSGPPHVVWRDQGNLHEVSLTSLAQFSIKMCQS